MKSLILFAVFVVGFGLWQILSPSRRDGNGGNGNGDGWGGDGDGGNGGNGGGNGGD